MEASDVSSRHEGPGCKLPIRKTARRRKLHDSRRVLTTRVDALSGQLEQLKLRNSFLNLRANILEGLCAAGHLAAAFLSDVAGEHPVPPGAEEEIMSFLPSSVLSDLPCLGLERFSAWFPSQQTDGWSKHLVKAATRPHALTGPTHASMLDGNILSILHAILMIAKWDAQVQQGSLSLLQDQAEVLNQKQGERMRDAHSPFFDLRDKPEGWEPSPEVLLQFIAWLMEYLGLMIGSILLDPLIFSELTRNAEGKLHLPPPSLLDEATEALELSQAQLQTMLQGLRILQGIQEPLNQQEAAINRALNLLLDPATALGPHGEAVRADEGSTMSTAATAAPGEAAAGRDGAAAAYASRVQSTTGAGGAEGPSLAPASSPPAADSSGGGLRSSSIEGSMAGLGSVQHQRLVQLTVRLGRVQYKLVWMDFATTMFALGQLTWMQIVKFNVVLMRQGYFPSIPQFARRLAARSSLMPVPAWAQPEATPFEGL